MANSGGGSSHVQNAEKAPENGERRKQVEPVIEDGPASQGKARR